MKPEGFAEMIMMTDSAWAVLKQLKRDATSLSKKAWRVAPENLSLVLTRAAPSTRDL